MKVGFRKAAAKSRLNYQLSAAASVALGVGAKLSLTGGPVGTLVATGLSIGAVIMADRAASGLVKTTTLERKARVVEQTLARARGEGRLQSRISGTRAALARGAAARTTGARQRPSTLGVRSALARGAKDRGGDGSVKAYTRTQNGKTVQVGGYQRTR